MSLILPGARQDVRRGAVHRGGQSAACCPEPALRSAQVLLSEQAWRSGQQALPGADGGAHLRSSGAEDLLRWTDAQWAEQRAARSRA
ncbi:hypothetical oxidoreductase [Bradyrhizobium sp.]|nr:hypothetical oxidoreductase [Bradyrhizobium sp.]